MIYCILFSFVWTRRASRKKKKKTRPRDESGNLLLAITQVQISNKIIRKASKRTIMHGKKKLFKRYLTDTSVSVIYINSITC